MPGMAEAVAAVLQEQILIQQLMDQVPGQRLLITNNKIQHSLLHGLRQNLVERMT
jgi:hypothetical protein